MLNVVITLLNTTYIVLMVETADLFNIFAPDCAG